jgi:hypothetical protein
VGLVAFVDGKLQPLDPAKSTPWPKLMVFRVILVKFFPCLSYAQSYVRLSVCWENATQKAKIWPFPTPSHLNAFVYIVVKSWLYMTTRVAALLQDIYERVWGAGCRFGDFGLDVAAFIMVWDAIRMRGETTVSSNDRK